MKRFWLMLGVAATGTLALAAGPSLTRAADFKTAKLEPLCGKSDAVYDLIVKVMNEKCTIRVPLKQLSGVSGRNLFIYADGSWFLTYEFLARELADDETCIMATGERESAYDAIDLRFTRLPAKRI